MWTLSWMSPLLIGAMQACACSESLCHFNFGGLSCTQRIFYCLNCSLTLIFTGQRNCHSEQSNVRVSPPHYQPIPRIPHCLLQCWDNEGRRNQGGRDTGSEKNLVTFSAHFLVSMNSRSLSQMWGWGGNFGQCGWWGWSECFHSPCFKLMGKSCTYRWSEPLWKSLRTTGYRRVGLGDLQTLLEVWISAEPVQLEVLW